MQRSFLLMSISLARWERRINGADGKLISCPELRDDLMQPVLSVFTFPHLFCMTPN